jgi:hypothetical protein
MKVIDKRYEDTVLFSSLKVGDTFLDIDVYGIVYMKIVSVNYGGYEFNAVNLFDGSLVGFENSCDVVAVEAEVSYK